MSIGTGAADHRPKRRWSANPTHPFILFPAIAVLVLGILWGTVINLVAVERAAAERAAVLLSRELVDTYEAQVVRALREIDRTLKFVKYIYEVEGVGANEVLERLKARNLLLPELLFTISIADRAGQVVASTRADARRDVSARAAFQLHRQGSVDDLWIGQPAQDNGAADDELYFSRRLQTRDGVFAGVVALSVSAGYFVSGYEAESLGTEGVLGIVGMDGVFRVRRSGDAIHVGDRADYESAIANTERPPEQVEAMISNWDGVRRYMNARELYEFPVVVVAGLSRAEQLARAEAQARKYYLSAGLVSAMLLAVLSILGRMSWQLARARQRETDAAIAHAEQVEYLAYHDGLTGLPNRSLFSKLLTQHIALAQRNKRHVAVMFLDLDRFKSINDTLGHDAGDELLKEVAARLQHCLRDSDTVARLGGDEFVVILPDLQSAEHAAAVAQKILVATAKPFVLLGTEFSVTASIGIATYPRDGRDEQTLTKNADVAMYHAKDEGKNNFQFYSQTLSADAFQRLALESNLRHALARGELTLHYQPKRDVSSGRITGMEALLRWQHPDLGLIPPTQFIGLAEETGLIVPIGKWVLDAACAQNVAWQREGLRDLVVAVNVTTRQFFEEKLLPDLQSTLQATGMAPELLELEVPESVLVHDRVRALEVLNRLKAMGVRIAIDEFGVGYSSLATLEKFPIDTVKIDRSFIRDVVEAAGEDSLTSAVIAVGKSLSLSVVAQGVETREQVEFLRERHCHVWQGFYFDLPGPGDEMTEVLRAQQTAGQ